MEREFWASRWAKQHIGFHEGATNRMLQRFESQLSSKLPLTAAGAERGPRILVPLCGKSEDLFWLRAKGYSVTGVEYVRDAATAFFAEHELAPEATQQGPFERLKVPGIELWVGDFFALPAAGALAFDVAYDRAALVAVKPEDRKRYVDVLLNALKPAGRVLLVSFVYDASLMAGPPFSVDEGEVHSLFSARCSLKQLADEDILASESRFRERGLTSLREQAWLIEKRS